MKFEVLINNARRIVELQRTSERWSIALDGHAIDADAIEIAPNIFSILLNGKSHEVRITPTPTGALTLQTDHQEFTAELLDSRAWRGRRHRALEAEGRQQIIAPMPGKIVDLGGRRIIRSEEHTSELQSPDHLVCRLLLEKKKVSNNIKRLVTIECESYAYRH